MSEKLIRIFDKLCHDLSIAELQQLYKNRDTCELSYHDTLYLNIILTHPNRYTPSQIADLLKVSRPAVTQKINELCKKGYVIKTQNEVDKRLFHLSINPQKSFYTEEDRRVEMRATQIVQEKYGEADTDKMCDMIEFLVETIYNEKLQGEQHE